MYVYFDSNLECKPFYKYARSEVLTAVITKITMFWDVMLSNMSGCYSCSGGTCCLHLQSRRV
jgi:hypothetical protein